MSNKKREAKLMAKRETAFHRTTLPAPELQYFAHTLSAALLAIRTRDHGLSKALSQSQRLQPKSFAVQTHCMPSSCLSRPGEKLPLFLRLLQQSK